MPRKRSPDTSMESLENVEEVLKQIRDNQETSAKDAKRSGKKYDKVSDTIQKDLKNARKILGEFSEDVKGDFEKMVDGFGKEWEKWSKLNDTYLTKWGKDKKDELKKYMNHYKKKAQIEKMAITEINKSWQKMWADFEFQSEKIKKITKTVDDRLGKFARSMDVAFGTDFMNTFVGLKAFAEIFTTLGQTIFDVTKGVGKFIGSMMTGMKSFFKGDKKKDTSGILQKKPETEMVGTRGAIKKFMKRNQSDSDKQLKELIIIKRFCRKILKKMEESFKIQIITAKKSSKRVDKEIRKWKENEIKVRKRHKDTLSEMRKSIKTSKDDTKKIIKEGAKGRKGTLGFLKKWFTWMKASKLFDMLFGGNMKWLMAGAMLYFFTPLKKIIDWVWKKWEALFNFLGIKGGWGKVMAGIAAFFTMKGIGKKIISSFKSVGKAMWAGLKTGGKAMWAGLKTGGKAMWAGLKTGGKAMWTGLKGAGKGLIKLMGAAGPIGLAIIALGVGITIFSKWLSSKYDKEMAKTVASTKGHEGKRDTLAGFKIREFRKTFGLESHKKYQEIQKKHNLRGLSTVVKYNKLRLLAEKGQLGESSKLWEKKGTEFKKKMAHLSMTLHHDMEKSGEKKYANQLSVKRELEKLNKNYETNKIKELKKSKELELEYQKKIIKGVKKITETVDDLNKKVERSIFQTFGDVFFGALGKIGEISKGLFPGKRGDANVPVARMPMKPSKGHGVEGEGMPGFKSTQSPWNLYKPYSPNVSGIQGSFRDQLVGLGNSYKEQTGMTMQINSGFRSIEKQKDLYKQMGGKGVARPGYSMHNYGYAVDINSSDANRMDKYGLLSQFGLHRPVTGEPWHVEPSGLDRKGVIGKNYKALQGGLFELEGMGSLRIGRDQINVNENGRREGLQIIDAESMKSLKDLKQNYGDGNVTNALGKISESIGNALKDKSSEEKGNTIIAPSPTRGGTIPGRSDLAKDPDQMKYFPSDTALMNIIWMSRGFTGDY